MPRATEKKALERTTSASIALESADEEKKHELLAFLFLAVVLAPLLAVMIVGGYGFAVWIYQIFAGPPGPPSVGG